MKGLIIPIRSPTVPGALPFFAARVALQSGDSEGIESVEVWIVHRLRFMRESKAKGRKFDQRIRVARACLDLA